MEFHIREAIRDDPIRKRRLELFGGIFRMRFNDKRIERSDTANPKSKIASKTNQRGKIGTKVKGHVMSDYHHPTPRP
jgi:hypothetical protein